MRESGNKNSRSRLAGSHFFECLDGFEDGFLLGGSHGLELFSDFLEQRVVRLALVVQELPWFDPEEGCEAQQGL